MKNFYYFARGVKFDNQDYTAKCVFVENDKGQIFYNQSLFSIEKGNLIEMIKNKSIVSNNGLDGGPFNLVNTKDSPNIYYDKRLIRICQVPQMPYLEFNTDINMYQPMKEAIEAVKDGSLYIKKLGQEYINELVPHNFRSKKNVFPLNWRFFPDSNTFVECFLYNI